MSNLKLNLTKESVHVYQAYQKSYKTQDPMLLGLCSDWLTIVESWRKK